MISHDYQLCVEIGEGQGMIIYDLGVNIRRKN